MNIAIFGGSFDPYHIGHQKIVGKSFDILDIDKLFIVPTYLNPFKNISFLDANIRLDLINTLYKDDSNIVVVDFEVKQKQKVTTFETISFLKEQYTLNTIYLIIGADNLKDIHLWYNFDYIKNNVKFVVVNRDNIDLNNKYIEAIHINLDENISSSKLRIDMDLKYIPTKIQKKVKKLWNNE
jgi:nicotinate-nucleotide adenylyltransferase